MGRKHRHLWLYNLALLCATLGMASLAWPWQADWPPVGVVLAFVLFQLLIWHYGFPVPSMGLTSMERVPQVAALLLFPLEVAVTINALPALIFPFINRRYRQGSLAFGALRAVHNVCMVSWISLAGGWCYRALGGEVPLLHPDWGSLGAVLVAMVAMQVVNSLMMVWFLWLDRRDVRRIATWNYLLSDSLFVPIGVLAALICAPGEPFTITLFALFVLLTVISMHELVESRRQMQDRVVALDAASGARLAISGSQRMDQLAERLLDHIGALLPFRIAYVALHDAERREFDVVLEMIDGERRPRYRRPVEAGLSGQVLASGQPLRIENWDRAPEELRARAVLAPGEQPGSALIVPIRWRGQVLGLVSVQHSSVGRYSEADLHALVAIADDIAAVIADARTFEELDSYRRRLEGLVAERTAELEQAGREREHLLAELQRHAVLLERQSREDALTGLANRRHFDERITVEIQAATERGSALSLALVDLDHFKNINDTAGHAAGDAVLKRVAALLQQRAPAGALVARIGGEEFALILPGLALSDATALLESLRCAVAQLPLDDLSLQDGLRCSAGVSVWRAGDDHAGLLRRADRGLYAAKRSGRDRVCEETA